MNPEVPLLVTLLQHYLKEPALDSFLAVRNAWLAEPAVNRRLSLMPQAFQLMNEEKYDEASRVIARAIFPHCFLNPGAHLLLSICLEKMGQQARSRFELGIAHALMNGIKLTGDGSEERPWQVTSVADEYDCLMAEKQELVEQAVTQSNGRMLDRIQVTDGRVLYFDVTDIFGQPEPE